MKKLLLVSIVLVVAGLGLILYSDPIIAAASGSGPHPTGGITTFTNANGGTSSGGGPTFIGNGPGQNGTIGAVRNNFATMEYITIAGISVCGVGLILSAVETVKPSFASQSRTVT